jgi:hypothetical protein
MSLHTVTAAVIILAAILKCRPQITPFTTSRHYRAIWRTISTTLWMHHARPTTESRFYWKLQCISISFPTVGYLKSLTVNLLKPTGYRMHQQAEHFNNYTLCQHCIYVFCICLRTNSGLCHLHKKLIGFYNRNEKCLQRGTDWVFKWSSLRFGFKRLNVVMILVTNTHRWHLTRLFLGAFKKLRKANINFMSFRLSILNLAPTGRILIKFDRIVFFENLSRKLI